MNNIVHFVRIIAHTNTTRTKNTIVMKTNKYILTLLLAAWCAVGNLYAITSSYYSSIDGKSGKDLFDAIHTVSKTGYSSLSYKGLWTVYQTTDVYPTGHANAGKIWDMYGNCTFTYSTNQCGSYSKECDCYNREHSIPKSWFGGTESSGTPGTDLFHVVPTDGKVNGMRSNHAFGEVNAASYSYAGSKLGTAKSITISNSILNASGSSTKSCSSTPVFEPVDEYKGDFARGYLGTMIRWANGDYQTFTTDQGASIFNTAYDAAHYYGLTEYGVALLLKWHREDPVSQKEIDRNNGIQAQQGNRNPFIDYPCLVEYIWGDKAGQTLTLSSLVGTFTGSWTTGDGCPCGTDPAITLPSGDIDCGATTTNTAVTKTITVKGVNLSANLSLAVSGTNSSFFTLSATTIQKAVAETGSSVTITYKPTSTGSHTATLTISGGGLASNRTFKLSGTCCNPYNVTLSRNNITETVSACGTYTLPTAEEESDACDGWEFQGWITGSTSFTENQTTAPSYTTSVSSSTTLYAVYAKGTTGGSGNTQKSIYLDEDSVSSSYGTDTEVTRCGVTCYYTNVMKSSTSTIQMKKSGSYIANKASLTKIDSIIINGVTTLTVYGGTSAKPETTTITRSNNKYDFSGGNYSYFKIKNGTSGALYPTNIKIYYTVSGGGSSSTTYYTSTTNCAAACTKLDAPAVTATPGNGQITLTWADVTGADHYTVTISSKGTGYTTECGSASTIGTITQPSSGSNQCIITGLTNGLAYTTNVVANATSSTCDSDADTDTATPQDCTPWDDPTLSWNQYSLNTTTNKTATVSVGTPTHGTLSFESSNPEVLTVNQSTGAVTTVGSGEATVTAHWTANDGYCEKTMTSSTFEVAGPLTISFNANADGVTGTMTDQTVTYKVSTAIKDNAFRREGYTFIGWATSADGEKVYNDKQSVAFTNSQTLYAKWQLNSRNVTFTPSPSGATVTVNGKSTSPQAVNYGETVTVHIAPANHYTITTVSIKGATSGNDIAQTGSGETRTFTMPDENVTVSVTMTAESQYTATFYNSGVAYGVAQTGYTDDDINAPATNPVSCDADEFTFVGWVAAEQISETTSKPEVLTFPQTMPVGNVNYYALYRRVEGSGGGEASVTFKSKTGSDDGTDRTEDSAIKENLVESYTGISSFSASRAYLGLSGVKLGASGGTGYITLNLSSPITTNTITVHAAKYGTDTGDLQIEVNGSNSFGSALSPADGTLTFTNSSEVEISDLTISTTSKRAYVASISLGGGGTSYYTTSPVCTPCEHKVTLTKGAETNGTFTLSKANGEYDNCKSNFTVTVSNISPAEGYRFKNVTATGGINVAVSGPDGSGNYAVNYAKGNSVTSTVTAHFEQIPSHTVTWSANGNTSNQVSYKEGAAITFPNTATGCDGMTFMGWSAVEVEMQDNAPAYTTEATMGTEDITFYAVFATETTTDGGSTTQKASSIAVGDVMILVYETGSKELSAISTTSTKYGIGTSYSTTPAGAYTLNVVAGNSEGSFAFKHDNVYLNWSSGNSLSSANSLSNNTSWNVTFSSGNAVIKNVNDDSREIRWNNNSGQERFACYTSGQQAVQLYKVGSSSTTTYTGYTTSCTPCDKQVTIVKGEEENGSFALSLTGAQDNCHSAGLVVTVTGITPDEDYEFDAITQTGIAEGVTIDQEAKTVAYAQNVKGASTINVTFRHKPQYTIKFYDNGSVISEQLVTINKSPVVPDDPEGCDEYEFVGWWTAELAEDNTATHTWVPSFTATENKNYYAVFRHVESGSGSSSINATFGTDWNSLFGTSYTGTFNPSANSLNLSGSNSGVSIDVTNGTSTNGYIKTSDFRIYSGYTVTITAPDGKNITSISLTKSNKNVADISASVGELTIESGNGSWEGSSNSVTFSASGTCGFSQIEVTVGGGGTTYYTTDTDCRDCSIPTLSFAATTVNKFDGDAPFRITPNVTGNTMGATVSYTSSNPTKAEVSDDGTVTIHDAMSTEPITITATLGKMSTEENCQKSVKASYIINIYNKVTWLVNGTPCAAGSQTTQTTEGGTIDTAPSEPDGDEICFGKTFVGWTTAEYEEDDAKPEVLYTSSSIVGQHITESTTFYAVFAELTGTLNQYRKGTPTQLTTGQKVIIVNTAAKKAMKAVSSFKGGYDVTPVADAFVTEEQTIIWTVEQVDGGGYYFMYDNKYLNATTTSLYLDGDEDAWTVTGAGPYIISSGKYPSYSLEWYSNEFKSSSTGSGDEFNMDLYFPNWTIGAYSTNCGLCLPKPEVQSVVVKQDRATVTWKSVAYATGYEFTCSGGEVAISGTTATITGLTPLSDYTYSLRAQGGDPYTCFRTTNGSFSTPDCDDMPYDITATPYNVVQAIIRWKAEAERGKVVVYNDEACTDVRVTIADTISPCTVSGLVEDTRYWFKLFGGASQDCASPVQTFLTQTTAVEIVEWQNDGVIILLTGDETTASVLIEDKQEHVEHAGNVADKLFISKYFEADGNNKMIAVYNGTKEKIDITNYWLKHSNKGSAETKICLKKFGKTPGQIAPNEEIIIMRFSTSTDPAIECAKEEENYDEWNIIDDTETSKSDGEGNIIYNWLNFSGPQSIGLYDGTTMIDVIGARTSDNKLVQIEASNKVSCSYATNSDNDGAGFSARGLERGTEDSITLSTNRCLLIRKNTVKSGDDAVATNVHGVQEECSEAIAKAFKTLSDEWVGYVIGKDASRTCQGLAEVGGFDYEGYYASYDTAVVVQELVQNPDGTITIPIPKLDTMSCSMLRINVYDKNTKEQKASREYRIPIMIQSGEVKSTNELFTKHGVAVCKDCDVLVFSGATLKKDNVGEDRDTIGNLTLYPGSTLELPDGKGDYHVKSLTYRVEGDSVPVTKLSADDHLYTETQRLVVTRRIKNDRYYFISFPYDVNVNEITLANGSKAVNSKDFRLMEYDAEARAAEGSLQGAPGHWKLFTGDKLLAGRGYAIAVNTKAMKEILFPMTLDSKNLTTEERTKQTNTVDINEYVGDARNTNHNWNLIAHPYITKFEVTEGAANVEAYWENPSRENTNWIDDWQTWTEDNPTQPTDSTSTQPTDTTHTQQPDTTTTHDVNIIMEGTLECGIVWVLYEDGSIELTGGGQMPDFTSLDAVPWAQHRQHIKNVKIGGEVQKIGQYAFSQCTNLMTVTIVAPVTNLASYAFAGCTQLRNFRIETTEYVSATNATFNNISSLTMISLQVPQSMYDQYSAKTPWNKMAISAFDENSNTGGAPRRAPVHDGWTESQGGVYITIPYAEGGKVLYRQQWIDDVTDIPPFTAVFIQGDGQGEMTFNMYPSGGGAPKRSKNADRYETRDHTVLVGLAINGNGQQDMTSLRLRPDFGEHYKFNLDLLKFTTFNTARPQIYIKTPDDQLAFRAISDSLAANTWIPVGVYCRDAGTYTFSMYDRYAWDEVEAVYLRDNVTGAETNLLMGNYTITTTDQIYTNTRFAVKVLLRRKVKDTPTMIDHTEDPNAPRKFFRDGLLYIMRDGKVYDLTGKPVQFDDLLNR